jgi:hypothetical protein
VGEEGGIKEKGRKHDLFIGEGPKDEGGGTNTPSSPTKTKTKTKTDSNDDNENARKRYKASTETSMELEKGSTPQSDFERDGESYIGQKITKDFEGVKHRGVVSNWDTDKEPGEEIWEVTYEDMDLEDLNHRELMKVLLPEEREGNAWGGGGQTSNNPTSSPRTHTSNCTDTFQQTCKERFEMHNVEEMKMYLKHLDKSLKRKFVVSFAKRKGKGPMHAKDFRVGEGLCFVFPENIPEYILERNSVWKANFREIPKKMMEESLAAASIIASRTRKRAGDVFSVNLNNEESFLVEKSSGKVLAPERVQDAIDRDDLELWLTAWNEELDGLSMDGEHMTHDHALAEVRGMGIAEPPLPTRMISAAKCRGLDFDRRKGRMTCQGFRAIKGVHHDGKSFAASPSQHSQ